MLKFSVLGSGSKGNSTLVQSPDITALIDVGLSARQICERLETLGITPDQIDAIFLTHEHGDHIRGLDVLLKNYQIPVYTNPLTREAITHYLKRSTPTWQLFETGSPFSLGTLKIQTARISHDAVDPVGYRFDYKGLSLAYISDLGFVSAEVKSLLRQANAVYIESNYDQQMLDSDSKRPFGTKQRIASKHGHLSNDQVSQIISEIASAELKHLVLGHLSSDCNCPNLALDTVSASIAAANLATSLQCSQQDTPTQWIELIPPRMTSGGLLAEDTSLYQAELAL